VPREHHDGPSTAELERGIKILQHFPTARTCETLFEAKSSHLDVWLSPTMINTCLAQVWTEYGHHLGQSRNSSSLAEMARELCVNGKHPVIVDATTQWKNWFGGPRIRWEMLSILFSFFGRAFKQREDWDPIFTLPEQMGHEYVLVKKNELLLNMFQVARLLQRRWLNVPRCA
jgi:hypothetical protein